MPTNPTDVSPVVNPTVLKEVRNWLANVTQHYGWNYYPSGRVWEDGNDFGLPYNTPVYSLTDGPVVGTGYYGGGGVVSIEENPQTIWYYQHLDENVVRPGDQVVAGQLIGYSGGQLSGGRHPATCCSSGPHIEVGVNAPFGGFWNPRNVKPQRDPHPLLLAIEGGSDPGYHAGDKTSSDTSQSNIGGCLAVFANILQWVLNPVRMAKLALGVILVVGAVALIILVRVGPEAVEMTGEVIDQPEVTAAGAAARQPKPSSSQPAQKPLGQRRPVPNYNERQAAVARDTPEEPVYIDGRKGYLRNGRFVNAE